MPVRRRRVGLSDDEREQCGTALTPARVAALVKNVTVNAGALGIASITNFASPERTWWANARVICCRYRAAIDTHARGRHRHPCIRVRPRVRRRSCSRTARSTPTQRVPARPATKTYAGATVTVNGQEVATVGVAGQGAVVQERRRRRPLRRWTRSVPRVVLLDMDRRRPEGRGDARHRRRCRRIRSSSGAGKARPTTSARNTRMTPTTLVGRSAQRAARCRAAATWKRIGPLTQWDARYLQTGSRYVRRAVVASALGALSCNVNARDRPAAACRRTRRRSGKTQDDGTWPKTISEPAWEVAHHPAVGLMAFLCQPSPAFIEIAQKIAIWNATALQNDGVFGFWSQVRGKAWGVRSLAHAIFLTPDGDTWKPAARSSLAANVRTIDAFRKSPNATLGFVWDTAPEQLRGLRSAHRGHAAAVVDASLADHVTALGRSCEGIEGRRPIAAHRSGRLGRDAAGAIRQRSEARRVATAQLPDHGGAHRAVKRG